MMSHSRSRRLRKWLRITAALLLGLLLLQVVFDPLALISDAVSVLRIRWELPRALERWEANAPSSYQIHVKGASMACFVDGELSVQLGELVRVRMRTNPLVPESTLVDIDPGKWDQAFCSYEDLTIEGMFERAQRGLEGIGAFGEPLSIEFDDGWGYITSYRSGRASGGGVFAPTVSDCCTWFEFDDLVVPAPQGSGAPTAIAPIAWWRSPGQVAGSRMGAV